MPSVGEVWRGRFQIGVETTPGTPVAATRIMYFRPDSSLSREREARRHRFMTTTRDNVRAATVGPVTAGGTINLPVSSAEMVELLLVTIKGAVTPTSGTWSFVPTTDLDTATVEWHDGAQVWQGAGMRGNTMRIAGSAQGENIATFELFGQNVVSIGSLAALTSERVPTFHEGWETRLYIDPAGTAPGTTQKLGTLINWDVTFNNNLGRKYFADNTLAAGAIPIGEMEVTGTFTMEGISAETAAEYDAWDNNTRRVVSLVFGQDAGDFLALDLPGIWSAVDLTGTDEGTRTYQFTYGYVFDSALTPSPGYGVRVRAKNARLTAWGAT